MKPEVSRSCVFRILEESVYRYNIVTTQGYVGIRQVWMSVLASFSHGLTLRRLPIKNAFGGRTGVCEVI